MAVGETENVSKDIGSRLDEIEMDVIVGVELDGGRRSLGTRPEGLTRFSLVVKREGVEELRNLVVEDILEHVSGEFNALIVVETRVSSGKLLDDFQTAS